MSSVIHACKLKRYKRPLRLHLNEVSALCLRGEAELLAVGDEDFMVATAALRDDDLRNEHSTWVRHILPDEVRDGKSGSEWEAIAADGKGRVFIVKESSLTVIVLSRSFDKHVHTIELDVEDGPDEDARQLLNDENAGPEGILLLEAGRLLAVKQKDPALLIEFGLPHSRSRPFKARSHLRREHHFELSKGPRTRLVPLRSWRLRDESNKDLESVNDLAVERNTVYAISSRSRCIFELPLRSNTAKAVVAQHRWRLPDEMELSGERKAEGLTFDRKGHPIVAIDSKDKDENVFLLEPLLPARD